MRLFVGLPIPPAQTAALAALAGGIPGARWIEPDDYHITLAFLGECDGPAADEVDQLLAALSADRFSLTIQGIGSFGSGEKIRTLWAGIAPSPPLDALQSAVTGRLRRVGFDLGRRRFKPHVTLARLAGAEPQAVGRFIRENNLLTLAEMPVERVILYESQLGRSGAHYTELRDYPLQGAGQSAFLNG